MGTMDKLFDGSNAHMLPPDAPAKLAQFEDLRETCEALREENDELRAELERYDKRFSMLAWILECAMAIAKHLPMPTNEEEPPKKARKRKVGAGRTATHNAVLRGEPLVRRVPSKT